MELKRVSELIKVYRDGLLDDVMPFWLEHCVDREYGGYMTAVDRDGSVIDTDKSVWFQGRFAWMLSTLCTQIGPRDEWLEAAKSGIDFMRDHCFDSDEKMYFTVTQEGKPLRMRRYIASEMFAIIAFAAYAKASGCSRSGSDAVKLFEKTMGYIDGDVLKPKVDEGTRPMKGLGPLMITIATAQELRRCLNVPGCDNRIDKCIDEIEKYFLNSEFEAVMEAVGPNGEFIDHYDGRTICPGHAIETAWFILDEARYRNNDLRLMNLGLKILDWSWKWGWDKQYGGILYFRDVKNLPVQEYWHDMKFWWPQNEAVIATLMAYEMTGDEKYEKWHGMIHEWAYRYFPDKEHGEWYGYLHRDGRVSTKAKGTMWKGPFHLPRMQLIAWQTLERIRRKVG